MMCKKKKTSVCVCMEEKVPECPRDVVTVSVWNILAPNLAVGFMSTVCDTATRFKQACAVLESRMKEGDVVMLQEVSEEFLDSVLFVRLVKAHAYAVYVKKYTRTMYLATLLPPSMAKSYAPEKCLHRAQYVVCGTCLLVNVHLPCTWQDPTITYHSVTKLLKSCYMESLKYPGVRQIVCAGDFNTSPNTLLSGGLKFGWYDATGEALTTTVHTVRHGHFHGALDHILVWSRDPYAVTHTSVNPVVSKDVLMPNEVWPSDHAMVTGTLQFGGVSSSPSSVSSSAPPGP